MNIFDELRHQTNLHPLRYLINQGEGVEALRLKTNTVNQGSIQMLTPAQMISAEFVKQAISSSRHPINNGISFFNRIIVNFKFKKCETFCHRFDLIELSGKIRPYLCSDKLCRQWEEFVRPNGSLFHCTTTIERFLTNLFGEVNVQQSRQQEILHALPSRYVNTRAIGWNNKFSERVETFFSRGNPLPRVVTKDCTEGIREIGIGKILAALNLDSFVFSGIGVKTKAGNPALVMPFARFEFVDYSDITTQEEIEKLQGIGIVHALFHVQDGLWANIARIDDNLRAYDLGKSLIPARTIQGVDTRDPSATFVSLMTADRETQITLCSALLETHFMDKLLPDALLKLFRDEKFIQKISGFRMNAFLDPQDPVRKDKNALELAENQFLKRAKRLSCLCKKKNSITLAEVFIKLYPQEMRFVAAAKKLKMFRYHSIFPNRILKKAQLSPNLFTNKEIRNLERALQYLESATLPTATYQSFII